MSWIGSQSSAGPRCIASLACVAAAAASTFGQSALVWQQSPAVGPVGRFLHAMTYDSLRQRTVMYGGTLGSNETWEFDGSQWQLRATWGPQHVADLGMAFDAAHHTTLVFGGRIENDLTDQAWGWNGEQWARCWGQGPSARHGHAMVFDAARGVIVVFGGQTDLGQAYNAETWIWNGVMWVQLTTTGPSPRFLHAMAYDATRRNTVLFGGNNGNDLGDTWIWNGVMWTPRATPAPSPRYGHAMCFDSAREVVVLFGGDSGGGETWEWNGTAWTIRSIQAPPGRTLHGMSFDESRQMCIVFGGWGSTGVLGDTWELCAAPSIIDQPVPFATCLGGEASFSVLSIGSGPVSYQWRRDGAAIDGATDRRLTFTVLSPEDAASYDCVVSNSCGTIASTAASLSICFADFNCDSVVDFFDYLDFVGTFADGSGAADFNRDGVVDFFDYLDFVDAFATGC